MPDQLPFLSPAAVCKLPSDARRPGPLRASAPTLRFTVKTFVRGCIHCLESAPHAQPLPSESALAAHAMLFSRRFPCSVSYHRSTYISTIFPLHQYRFHSIQTTTQETRTIRGAARNFAHEPSFAARLQVQKKKGVLGGSSRMPHWLRNPWFVAFPCSIG